MDRMSELEKHKKYKAMYGSNEIFWGLGVEEETYFQFTKPIYVATPILRSNHKPERYSVDYYNSFKPYYTRSFDTIFPDKAGCIALPFFFNSHSFQKMDSSGQHVTTFEKEPQPNPKFSGKTFLEELQEFYPELFKDQKEYTFTFDGDTIEFMTQHFYRATAKEVITELLEYKNRFLKKMNEYLSIKQIHTDKGLLEYPKQNPGFAIYYSNPANVAMFNSGTYHINITIPTNLGPKDGDKAPEILNPELFVLQHKRCILLYQWLEPFLIAMYGTPDPLSNVSPIYTKSSQRSAISRYIGIGTYDTSQMQMGKILTVPIEQVRGSDQPFWWYTQYHKISGYRQLEKIGMDINFRKHYNHGIELRILDWFPESRLEEVIELLVHVADVSLIRDEAREPVFSETWNDLVVGVLQEGKKFRLTETMVATYEKVFGTLLYGKDLTVEEAYYRIQKDMKNYTGPCSVAML